MLKSFEELSQGALNFQEFEKTRKKAREKSKKALKMSAIIGGGAVLIGIILIVVGMPLIGFLLIIAGAAGFGIYYGITNSKAKKELKVKVLGDLLKAIDPSFKYSLGDSEFRSNFRKSGFVKSTSGTNIDDVFRGKMNDIEFALGEIRVTRRQSSGSSTRTITVYQGPFAFAKTSNDYGYTSIIPDRMEKSLGGVGKFLQKADLSRLNQKNIRIDEDPDFEKQFAVWTKDEQTTRQILNPQFREYLKGLATMTRTYLGWRDSLIYFGMDNRRNLFNLKLKNQITEGVVRSFYNDFADYYNILENVVSFVTTGVGAKSAVSSSDDVPPPPNNDTPPPPPPTGNTPPPPPGGNVPPPPPNN